MIPRFKHSRWRILLYPVLGIVAADLVYQVVVAWRAADILARAQPDLLVLAVINQFAVYVVLVPAMQDFYAAAGILLTGKRTFGLLATGLAVARIIPAGEYAVWRTATRKLRGGVTASTQWLIMYYAWMLAGLVVLFIVSQLLTFVVYPNAHVKTLVGVLRFLPTVLGVVLIVTAGLLLTRVGWVRDVLKRVAFDKFGSRSVSPMGIIRDRKLGRQQLGSLTVAAVSVWLIEGFTLYLCLQSIGLEPPLLLAIFGFTFARLFAMLPLTPGGIGVIETGSVLFFAAYGYPVGPVFTATVIYRLVTYWPALLVGGLTYLSESRKPPVSVALVPRKVK